MKKAPIVLGIVLAGLCSITACSGGSPATVAAPSPTKKWDFTVEHLTAAPRDGYYADQIPAIGDDGTIYAGGSLGLFAIRPDGTEKWHYDSPGQPANAPVHFVLIDDIGNIWFDVTSNDSGGAARVGPDGKGGEVGSIAPVTQLGSAFDGTVFMATSASVLQLSTSRDNPAVMWRGYATGMAFTSDGGMVFTRAGDTLSYADRAHSVMWNHKVYTGRRWHYRARPRRHPGRRRRPQDRWPGDSGCPAVPGSHVPDAHSRRGASVDRMAVRAQAQARR